MPACFRPLILLFVLLGLLANAHGAIGAPRLPRQTAASDAHLSLTVEPAVASVGSLVTLQIAYTGIGLYHTTISLSSPGALVFDPPRSMPCRYDQDPTACTRMTFRPRTPGIVTIRASATGEIHDPQCSCWYFSNVSDDGPVQVEITGSQIFIPLIHR